MATRRTTPAKPARRRLDTDARRAELLALGVEVFSAGPYDAVSIDAVAERAGISKGLLYHYFPTKRHFYTACVEEAARQLVDLLELPSTLPPWQRLHEGLERYLSFVERHAPAYSTLLRGGIGTDAALSAVIESTRSACLARLMDGMGPIAQDPTIRTVMRGWIGFVEATSLDWLDRRDLSHDALRDLWADALLRLLGDRVTTG